MPHADLPDAGRVSHFEIDAQLPAPNEKAALVGDPVPAGDANRYLTQNHAAGSFDGFANPAASVGLVAVNGVATTAMRSDGAPALDQGIIATWTALHTYNAGLAVAAGQGIAMADETSWFGIGAALERINVDAAGYVSVMGANLGIGTAAPPNDLSFGAGSIISTATADAADTDYLRIAGGGAASITRGAIVILHGNEHASTGALRLMSGNVAGSYVSLEPQGNTTRFRLLASGRRGLGTITPDRLNHTEASDAVTAAVTYAQRLTHVSAGAVLAGFGVGLEFELEENDGTNKVAGIIEAVWTDAGEGVSADADLVVKLMESDGAAAEVVRFTSDGSAVVSNDLILPKTSGKGIRVDTAAPTFGWRDLLGDVSIKTIGANDPDYNNYAALGIYRYQFKNNVVTEIFNDYHVPHDYVPGTEVHVHIHWSQTTIDTGGPAAVPGDAKWYFDANYSRGHDRGAFPAGVTTVSVIQTASGTIRKHMIAEVQLSTGGQIGGQDLEPDGIVTVRTYRDAADAADTLDQRPWVHHIDLHYQSTNIATKDKAPDFYA